MNFILDAKHESLDSRAMNKLDTKTRTQILDMLCQGAREQVACGRVLERAETSERF
jgi:hypothetical protein